MPQASVLSWSRHYDIKADGSNLTEASARQFLEDLLVAVRHGLERGRKSSTSSVLSVASVANVSSASPLVTSTPARPRTSSITEDMQYVYEKERIVSQLQQMGYSFNVPILYFKTNDRI
jgi:hypothetical protein